MLMINRIAKYPTARLSQRTNNANSHSSIETLNCGPGERQLLWERAALCVYANLNISHLHFNFYLTVLVPLSMSPPEKWIIKDAFWWLQEHIFSGPLTTPHAVKDPSVLLWWVKRHDCYQDIPQATHINFPASSPFFSRLVSCRVCMLLISFLVFNSIHEE